MKKALHFILFFIILITSSVTMAQTNVSGNITSNTIWTKAGSPYILTGNVGVPAAYTLTIEPGVTVQRNTNYQILLNGAMICNGSATDSIVFSSGSGVYLGSTLVYPGAYFVQFQKSNLSASSFRFVSFHNQNVSASNIQVGDESEFAQTSPKNSGTLKISRSNLSNGWTITKGYQAANSLNIDSSLMISATVIGYYPLSERINISNTRIFNSKITSDSYNLGIGFNNCYLRNITFTVNCCGANFSFNNCQVEDSNITNAGEQSNPVSITNSVFLNTIINTISFTYNIVNSKFIITKPISNRLYFSASNYVIIAGNCNMTNSEVINYTLSPVGAILINSSSATVNISNNTFKNLNDGVYVYNFNSIAAIKNNNFINTASYNILNYSVKNFSITNNYFQLKAGKTIDDMIFDSNDDLHYGTVTYTPVATGFISNTTISSPVNVVKASRNGQVLVTWNKNKETNLKNYKVYWGYVNNFTYANSATIAATDTSYTISGASLTDSIAVTALNTSSTGVNDQLNGYESWYSYAISAPPAITAFTPATAATGTTITITGTDFTGTTAVKFGGTAATSFTVVSPTTITAVVAAGASGSVSVTNSVGTGILAGFTYIPQPTISSFTPLSSISGAIVTITGTNFTNASSVKFGGTNATSFNIVSATSITAVVATGTSGNVSVTTPGGTANLAGFVFLPAPTITSFTPTAAGGASTVTITGTNFTGVTAVSIGGVAATSYSVVSSTSITAVVSTSATNGNVVVTTTGGTASLAGFTFLPGPTITAFTPTTGIIGTTVTITGTNFTGVTAVKFGGTNATSFTVNSATSITATVGSAVSGSITVTTPNGTGTLAGFTFIPAPTISSFSANTVPAGTTETLIGTGFTGATAVSFGGVPAVSFSIISSTAISAVVGPGGASGNISVTTPGGTGTIGGFVFVPAPIITSFTPTSASTGTTVTITGNYISGTSAVSFGGVPASSFLVTSFTTMTAVVGAGASGNLTVTTNGGTVSSPGFVYLPTPVVTSFSPATAIAGTLVTITGTNFTGATGVTFGGTPAASFTVNSATNITAVVGAGNTGNIAVSNANGLGSSVGFVYVPVPVISAGGPTTFITGGNVVLSATPGTGYSYQWIKDGANIIGATNSTYTATQSGSYKVSILANTTNQVSLPIVVTSVFGLPVNNFRITNTSATCKGSNNGTITILATQRLSYTATATLNGTSVALPFTDSLRVSGLPAGSYNICITVAGQPTYQQCFTAVVSEPKDLSVYVANIKAGNQVVISMGGGSSYNISLNGTVTTTTNSQVTLSLSKGLNTILVSTDKACQGVIEKNITVSDEALIYPNPFDNILNLSLGNSIVKTAAVNIYSTDGKVAFTTKYNNVVGSIPLNLSGLKAGLYVLKLSTDSTDSVFKIIKR
ncbi:IPT/TIG domain-containing protein [Mucilaginibacter sp. HMF5004]|uniref:beta strand repeat-containing protein n=1 Tax=Mucilaginibacter rivuli TaxID=2857527 RepID=UPI001C5E50B7|nr:IPT/TIG domain-containing protein [Mucilaginibacter rivuli]MBW4891704.1 IPT/TIG domain-containing protein [Mucilaginibacter rivuli]